MATFTENFAKFTIGDRQIPIRVRLGAEARGELETLQTLPIPTASGISVPSARLRKSVSGRALQPSAVSTVSVASSSARYMAGGAEIGEGVELVNQLDAVKNLPAGVQLQPTGEAEVMGEIFDAFRQAMVMGLMLVFVVLILLFGPIFHSFTILMSLPLSLGGVVAGLWLTGNSISMPVVIGTPDADGHGDEERHHAGRLCC